MPGLHQLTDVLPVRCGRVLVPDLYKGKVGVDKEEAQHVRRAGSAGGGVDAGACEGHKKARLWNLDRAKGHWGRASQG